MSTDKRIVEAIPPRRQWDPRVVSGVKRVNNGEDPDRVALDLAMVVPGFSRTQLGAYTAAYNKLRQKRVKEGLFGGEEPDVADRDNKEQAVQALLGSEDVDVKKVPDEKLNGLIQGLGSITTESIDSQVSQIVSVMREQHASRNDVLEALRVHVGFNLREAREVLQEHLAESFSPADLPSQEFARALNKARVVGLGIPDLDALYDMVYDRISEEGEAFKDVLRYKATEKDIYDTIADYQDWYFVNNLKEATTDITYYANHLRKQFQGLSFTVAGLDKDMVIHVLAAFQYYFDKEEDPDSAMKILSEKWTTGEWGYTSSRGKIPRAKEAKALPEVVRWYNDFLEDREVIQERASEEGSVRKVDYKGYTISVHKNRTGMFTAKNDSGEPYANVPQFRSEEEAIAWDKKNVDQMTESSSQIREE